MKKLRLFIQCVFFTNLLAYLIYCCIFFVSNPTRPTYLDCGTIVSKSSDEVVIKYGVRTDLYLNIEFEKSGFKSINCEPTTYFSKKVGEKEWFNLFKETSNWYNINMLVGLVTLTVVGIVLIILLLMYLLPDSW